MVTGSMRKPAIGRWSVNYLDGRQRASGIRLLLTIHWVLTFAAVSASSGLSLHPAKDRLTTHTVSGRAIDRRNTYIRLHLKEHGVTPRTPEKANR
jgi:hypothetical protein